MPRFRVVYAPALPLLLRRAEARAAAKKATRDRWRAWAKRNLSRDFALVVLGLLIIGLAMYAGR
ncbi:MAG: hypothetical protein ACHREM_32695 [Polyangiales bacterium]